MVTADDGLDLPGIFGKVPFHRGGQVRADLVEGEAGVLPIGRGIVYKRGAGAGAEPHHFMMVQTWFFSFRLGWEESSRKSGQF